MAHLALHKLSDLAKAHAMRHVAVQRSTLSVHYTMSHSSSLLQDEPVLRLQLAEDGGPAQTPLEASESLLRCGSSCARDMPQDSSTWDLSNLLIDGQPVSRDTVTAWLNVLYMQLEGVHFLGSASVAALTATGLYQLLAFADAVGSIRGVLRACLPKEEVTIRIAVEAIKCTLDASAAYTWKRERRQTHALDTEGTDGSATGPALARAATEGQLQAVTRQVVAQLEPLLYLAYKLQLGPLQQQLHTFIATNMAPQALCPPSTINDVITQRVVLAAAGSPKAKEALVQQLVLLNQQKVLDPSRLPSSRSMWSLTGIWNWLSVDMQIAHAFGAAGYAIIWPCVFLCVWYPAQKHIVLVPFFMGVLLCWVAAFFGLVRPVESRRQRQQ